MTVGVERPTLIRAAVLFLAAGGLLGSAPPAHAHRRSASVLRWAAPRQVDRGKTTIGLARRERRSRLSAIRSLSASAGVTHGGIPITGISCPTASLCVVVDLNGNVLTTATPDRPGTWKRFLVDGRAPLDAVSCSSPTFCAAVDTNGDVVTSTEPTAGPAAWTIVQIRPAIPFAGSPMSVPLTAISCPSSHLCLTGDDFPREIITTTDPAGGPAAWNDGIGIGHAYSADGLVSVSCSSVRFCATVSDDGVHASTDPTGPASTKLGINNSLEAISCGSRTLCLAVVGGQENGGPGGVWRSTNPAAPRPRWALALTDPNQQFAVACRGRGLCVATDSAGLVMMSAHPAAAHPAWQTRRVDATNVMSAISCPT
ncbi:MAG TPA: hypothetical protein VHW04_22800, partial [Solirubrobacteraceae bacterium]|nr:hypothetical protein [Solirubrobacteraceae bacterium]